VAHAEAYFVVGFAVVGEPGAHGHIVECHAPTLPLPWLLAQVQYSAQP
jgi:hypothetical protein